MRNEYIVSILLLGFITIATQIIMLREFLTFFYGNELVIGMILAIWMILNGLGAYLGKYFTRKRERENTALLMLGILSILPIILVFSMYILRDIAFIPGSMINLSEIFLSSFIILLPFCVIAGLVFTFLGQTVSSHTGNNLIDKTYSWESTGSIVGGVLFNLILIWFLETFHSLLFLALLSLAILLFTTIRLRKIKISAIVLTLLAGVLVLSFYPDSHLTPEKFLYKGEDIQYYKSTPYGNIAVTKTGEQVNFYENNVMLFSSHQPVLNEETAHFAMLQHSKPKKVLMLSAGVPGLIKEIMKYDVQQIDYVEINPWLINILKDYSGVYAEDRIRVINKDAREYIENTDKKYDVILIGLPEPNTIQLNRFYTKEFYDELSEIAKENAVISFSISGSSNYLSEETARLYSSLKRTLHTNFRNVIIIPGENNYFLASNGNLHYKIGSKADSIGLDNQYVNGYYLQDDLIEQRGNEIIKLLNEDIAVNKDFKPLTYSLKLRQWTSQFQFNFWLPLVIAGIAILYFILSLHPVNKGMFLAGFTGASLEIVLLVAFQIMFGSVFQMVGVIVTVFMAGLAFGTYYRNIFIKKVLIANFHKLQFSLGIYTILTPALLLAINSLNMPLWIARLIIIIMMFVAASMVGMFFSLSSQLKLLKPAVIASEIYSLDLLGAALGSYLVSIYLIPMVGLINVCFLIGGVVILFGFFSKLQLSEG
ncbi:MAG: fused MFS/spermidine synthase [Bacteroidales bacterium]